MPFSSSSSTVGSSSSSSSTSSALVGLAAAAAFAAVLQAPPAALAAPNSKPYVAYRTSPFDEEKAKKYEPNKRPGSRTFHHRPKSVPTKPRNLFPGFGGAEVVGDDPRCPLQFRIGLSSSGPSAGNEGSESKKKKSALLSGGRNAVKSPPVIHPIHPASGPGKQVLYSTVWERLDMLNPVPPGVAEEATHRGGGSVSFEGMSADSQFPLLLESANLYYAEPIVHDANGDGVPEAILVDYDGLVIFAGLDYDPPPSDGSSRSAGGKRTRHYHTSQIPRLYVRKNWVECATNKTKEEEMSDWDPYHSYFEYGVEWNEEYDSKRLGRVISGDVVEQELEDVKELEKVKEERKERTKEKVEEERKAKGEAEARAREEEEEKRHMEAEKAKAKQEEEANANEEARQDAEGNVDEKEEAAKEDKETADQEAAKEGGGDADAKKDETAAGEEEKPDNNGANANEAKQEPGAGLEGNVEAAAEEGRRRRRLQEVPPEGDPAAAAADGGAGDGRTEGADGGGDEANNQADGGGDGGTGAGEGEGEGNEDKDKSPGRGGYPDDEEDEDVDYAGHRLPGGYGSSEEEEEAEYEEMDDDYARYRRDRDANAEGEDQHYMDDEYPQEYYGDDDYYGGEGRRYPGQDHYSDSNYIRIPPHVLSRPALVEMPKRYKSSADDEHAKEEFLVVAVSYYFDEDEFLGVQSYRRFRNKDGGDETPRQRGSYVASAVMLYNVQDKRWETQEHLDLSTDYTSPANLTVGDAEVHTKGFNGMIAMALASPTIAVWGKDDQRRPRIVVGTSMGLLYALDVPTAYVSTGFPVQFEYPIVRRALVEDVVSIDSEGVEIVAMDEGGNVVCLRGEDASTVWHRDLLAGEREPTGGGGLGGAVVATSEMSLGDVDGDGVIDVVLAVRVAKSKIGGNGRPEGTEEVRVYALDGTTGDDIPRFPIMLEEKKSDASGKGGGFEGQEGTLYGGNALDLVQPLLVDLHAVQSHWTDALKTDEQSNGGDPFVAAAASSSRRKLARDTNDRAASGSIAPLRPLHGGNGLGLHVVQPLGSDLHVVEGGTGCAQRIGVGERVGAMVQADDVHGTGTMDLIVTTTSGRVMTLEVPDVVPYHPLNAWGSGSTRGGTTNAGHAQGYSASAGVFVRPESRTYRDWLGLYVPVTFEIFDRNANVPLPDGKKREYLVEFRAGTSHKRAVFRKMYSKTGTKTERLFIPLGPGYYALTLRMTLDGGSGLVFEDTFHVGYNVNYTAGLAWLVLVPLFVAAVPLLMYRRTPNWEEDDDYNVGGSSGRGSGGGSGGILG